MPAGFDTTKRRSSSWMTVGSGGGGPGGANSGAFTHNSSPTNNVLAGFRAPPGRAISGQNSNNYGRLFLVPNFGCNIINHTITRTSEACNMLYFDSIIKVKRMK